VGFRNHRTANPNLKRKGNEMSIEVSSAKYAIHDKLESQIKTAEAKLDTLKARAEVAKANLELKAIAALAMQKVEIHEKLRELKASSEANAQYVKKDLEARIAAFEKSIKEIEAKVKAH
jgi:multidrug efflux pump subunit AcrA (membrane-fusion protein)